MGCLCSTRQVSLDEDLRSGDVWHKKDFATELADAHLLCLSLNGGVLGSLQCREMRRWDAGSGEVR